MVSVLTDCWKGKVGQLFTKQTHSGVCLFEENHSGFFIYALEFNVVPTPRGIELIFILTRTALSLFIYVS